MKEIFMHLIQSSLTANRCQRNWTDEQVTEEHLDTILQCANNMPSKQNVDCYTILASQNKEFNNFCYKHAISNFQNTVMRNKINRNTQVAAPTLILWLKTDNQVNNNNIFNDSDKDIAVGISSGVASFVANELGYRTGFCKCFKSEPILKKLRSDFDINFPQLFLMLGVGKPVTNFKHNEIVLDNQVVRSVKSTQNQTKILKIL